MTGERRFNSEFLRLMRAAIMLQYQQDAVAHVDIGVTPGDPTRIVLLGTLGGRDYVRVFSFHMSSAEETLNLLFHVHDKISIGKIDAPGDLYHTIREDLARRRSRPEVRP